MNLLRLSFAFCVGILAVSACSGSNGAPTGPIAPETTAPAATPSPAPTSSSSAGIVSPATEHQVAQADFQVVRPLLIETQLEQGLSASSFARKPMFARAHRMATGSCDSGSEFSSSSSGATTNFTLDFFYDSACTMPWQNIAGSETATSSSSESIVASDTVDGKNGMQVEYDSINGSVSESSSGDAFSVNASIGPAQNNVSAQLAADCTVTQTSQTSDSEACQYGDLATLPAFMGYTGFGTVLNEMATVTANSSGYSTNGSGSATFYEGAASAMAITNTGTTVAITGATTTKGLTETENISSTGGTPTATLTVTDTADNVIVTFNLANYTITGSVENATTKAVEATFALDANGNGTITYSDGSTGTVTMFGIVS